MDEDRQEESWLIDSHLLFLYSCLDRNLYKNIQIYTLSVEVSRYMVSTDLIDDFMSSSVLGRSILQSITEIIQVQINLQDSGIRVVQ